MNNKIDFTNGEKGTHHLMVRITKCQRERLKTLAKASGYNTLSSFVRSRLLQPSVEMKLNAILNILKKGEGEENGYGISEEI